MAISDDFQIIESAFSCDSTDGWTAGGNASDPTSETDNPVEGSAYLGLQTGGTGDCYWYHDVSSRFKITEKNLGFWFKYIKGKGANYLVQDGSAVVMRLYFGGTSKYADYRVTERGDLDLKFGWQPFIISGSELNGGSVGGGHDGGSDFSLDIYRVELHLNVANKVDQNLGLDCVFIGTTITLSDQEYSFADLYSYVWNDRSFPIGVVEYSGKIAEVSASLVLESGSSISEIGRFVHIRQMSQEVRHDFVIESGASASFEKCFIAKPPGMTADLLCSGELSLVSCKVNGWDRVEFSSAAICDFSNNSSVYAVGSGEKRLCSVHDDSGGQGGAFKIDGDGVVDAKVFACRAGYEFKSSRTIHRSSASGNTGDDCIVDDGVVANIVDCSIDKIGGE